MKTLDLNECLALLPELEKYQFMAKDGPLVGCPYALAWGKWQAKTDKPISLRKTGKHDVHLVSSHGEFELKGALATQLIGDDISGVVLKVEHRRARPGSFAPETFRCYVKVRPELESSVFFPESLHDPSTGVTSRAVLPLQVAGELLEVFFVKDGPYLIIESASQNLTLESFELRIGAIRQFLSYLSGESLDGDTALVVPGSSPNEVRVIWYQSRGGAAHIYSVVPTGWVPFYLAKESLNLPATSKPLDPVIISRCVEKIVKSPQLVAPLEYLKAFPAVPVEMRGAFLSVALESLTDQLEKAGLLSEIKLMESEKWQPIETALCEAVDSIAKGILPEKRTTLVNRIKGLNRPTNADKLRRPFEVLSVPLTKEEKKALEERNRVLHTGRLLRSDEIGKDPEAWRTAYITEMRMFTAINKLLLTYVGYEGPIINWGDMEIGADEMCFFNLIKPAQSPQQQPT